MTTKTPQPVNGGGDALLIVIAFATVAVAWCVGRLIDGDLGVPARPERRPETEAETDTETAAARPIRHRPVLGH